MRVAVFLCLFSTVCLAGEFAVLTNGARLRCERHETEGGKLRLIDKSGGFTELDAAQVAAFEAEPAQPAAPAVAASAPAPSRDARQLADAAADKYGLPRELVRSVVKAES